MADIKKILGKVRKLEITTASKSENLLAGAYESLFIGRGIEFSEAREYVPGDDIRAIDWNVTARMNAPYVKEFIEERDLTVYIVFDVSASGDFGSSESKKDVSSSAAASIMFAALSKNDRVGLCLFSDGAEKFIPPKKGRRHAMYLLREIISYCPKKSTTNLAGALRFLSNVAKTRSVIFIVSDFVSGSFIEPLKMLAARHDVVAVKICDPREREIPDIGYALIEDSETGEQMLVNTSDADFREKFFALSKERRQNFVDTARKAKVDFIEVSHSRDVYPALRGLFRMRRRKR